ncbi:GPO family capsid scaffolding protein [Pseudomonas aeruginosa]|uniref:GPO family capsid scaffolding protein n=1 Tax=Pseudomonas aeruginosa TaxID=287 RepID=UPI0022EBEC66|nr:GPO family capsid scaffolding protein [Pseudomonas aeruginosa]HBN9641673.1 GPO family capsid scaffolding protein [Pseudomonas aeruginosa]HCE6348131.1 GPO family capsid scaffolding protein [Pseudomonas aeruginosa]
MTTPAKKFRSKWFRIFVEGATTDGRIIERAWVEQMAATYDPKTYGARLNCEHIRGLGPDSVFGSFGDVLALKAEEVEIAGAKKLGLFAQIEPTASLIELNKKGQKIYTSAEVQPNFAESGKAYLVGLAITDSPASLGTEALKFNAHRKLHKDNLFSAAEEVALEFEEVADTVGMFAALRDKVSDLLGKGKEKEGKDAATFTALGELIEQIATHGAEQAQAFSTLSGSHSKLQAAHDKLHAEFTAMVKKLGETDSSYTTRPPVTGGAGQVLAEF